MHIENPSLRRADQGLLEVNSGDAWGHAHTDASARGTLSASPRKANGRRILIIQSDWESGMSRLALDLKDAGHKVSKVFFCAPDLIYAYRGVRTHLFRKPIAEFESWLRQLVQKHGYDTFFLYNHYRPYNQIAWDLAHELNLDCQVFELGLIRPDCVMVFDKNTLPIDEVPRLWEKVLSGDYKPQPVPRPAELCQVNTTAKLIQFCTNFLFSRITYPLFPHFVDQRQMNLWHHLKHSMIHLVRFIERDRDCELDPWFAGDLSDRYYAVPLQVHSDTQIIKCSDFTSIEQFIRKVAISFANHAPADTKLVFKVHPMDRGYKDYSDLITGLNHRIGGNRLLYVDRIHLPTLLETRAAWSISTVPWASPAWCTTPLSSPWETPCMTCRNSRSKATLMTSGPRRNRPTPNGSNNSSTFCWKTTKAGAPSPSVVSMSPTAAGSNGPNHSSETSSAKPPLRRRNDLPTSRRTNCPAGCGGRHPSHANIDVTKNPFPLHRHLRHRHGLRRRRHETARLPRHRIRCQRLSSHVGLPARTGNHDHRRILW